MPALIPFTFMTSSGLAYGRPLMMACAVTGPMPGKASSSSWLAVFSSTFGRGAVLSETASRPVLVFGLDVWASERVVCSAAFNGRRLTAVITAASSHVSLNELGIVVLF